MSEISREVSRFVAERIDSVGQLEVLMLLRADPGRAWTAAEVSHAVGGQARWSELQLEYLLSQGLLAAERGEESVYRHSPRDEALAGIVERVSDAFAARRNDVVALLFEQPRSDRLRSFADAFRLRRED